MVDTLKPRTVYLQASHCTNWGLMMYAEICIQTPHCMRSAVRPHTPCIRASYCILIYRLAAIETDALLVSWHDETRKVKHALYNMTQT